MPFERNARLYVHKNTCSLNINALTHMELSITPLQTTRRARREDQVLWSSDNTERHYTYGRQRLPRYQRNI